MITKEEKIEKIIEKFTYELTEKTDKLKELSWGIAQITCPKCKQKFIRQVTIAFIPLYLFYKCSKCKHEWEI